MPYIKDTSGRAFLLSYIEFQQEQLQATQQQLERFAKDFSCLLSADDGKDAVSSFSKAVWQNNCGDAEHYGEKIAMLCLKIASHIGQTAAYCEDLAEAARAFVVIQHGARAEHVERVSVLALEISLFHRVWFNGKGSPYKMAGKSIPLASRIFALSEYAASITEASIRLGRSDQTRESLSELLHLSRGTMFDADLVDALYAVVAAEGGA